MEEVTAVEYKTPAPKGAALLDEKRPGWAELINLDDLELSEATRCILGQLYGWYFTGLIALFDPTYDPERDYDWRDATPWAMVQGVEHGFDIAPQVPYSYRELHAEWESLIKARQEG